MAEQVSRRIQKRGIFEPRTKTAKIRAVLPMIEIALANGHSYARCIEALEMDITEQYFRVALHRVRKNTRRSPLLEKMFTAESTEPNRALENVKTEPEESRRMLSNGAVLVHKKMGGMFISHIKEKDHITNKSSEMEDYL